MREKTELRIGIVDQEEYVKIFLVFNRYAGKHLDLGKSSTEFVEQACDILERHR